VLASYLFGQVPEMQVSEVEHKDFLWADLKHFLDPFISFFFHNFSSL
jgi:hypothetical protein